MEIDAGELDRRLNHQVERAGLFKSGLIFELNEFEIRNRGNFSPEDIEKIKDAAAKALLPVGLKTVKEAEGLFKERWQTITTDCPEFDKILGGGIHARQVTEVSGQSGMGKTQLCLQLSITVQYPRQYGGLAAGAVYICTEDRFPANRLHQMLNHFPRCGLVKEAMPNHRFGDYIYVDHVADAEGLKECVEERLPGLVRDRAVGLVVIDSIAGVLRAEYGPKEAVGRAALLRQVALPLRALAASHNLAVLAVNQVSDVVTDEGGAGGNNTVPALGLAWANLVTTRLQLVNKNANRQLQVVGAPHLAPASSGFTITPEGVKGLPDSSVS